ncbi:phage adaptor protein [Caballeronia zhejiangensis]|uniref:phage adaptor protein n=1 Tax=Caballeronia zhejiangensis TaxID=871203 RepID=UPI001F525FBF|nr:hypothetical protein [Caballeronia zhejiangensis]MCI1046922.1 hypothetical protein [Caballeronia zhejiangensis]
MFSSYDEFQVTVGEYLQRNNLADKIPGFIQLAEVRFRDEFNDFPQQKAAPYTLTPAAGTNVIALPSDCAAISLVMYGNHHLRLISLADVNNRNTQQDAYMFAEDGNNLYLQTATDGQKTLTIYYFAELDSLSSLNQSNWLLEEYPNIYLFATLAEAAQYLMDVDLIQLYEMRLQQALQSASRNKKQKLLPTNTKLVRKLK